MNTRKLSALFDKESFSAKARFMAVAAVVSVALAIYFGVHRLRQFPLDDAYIHLSYGRYFQWSKLLSFNGDRPDTGSSSWTWTGLCILIEQLGLPAYPALMAAAVAAFGYVLYRSMTSTWLLLPRGSKARRYLPYVSALLVATTGNIVWLAFSGMEALLLVALVMAFTNRVFFVRGMDSWAALLACLLLWTRVEAVVWLAPAAAALLLLPRKRRGDLRWLLVPLAGAAAIAVYHLAVSGTPLPTTAAGKKATFVASSLDAKQIRAFLRGTHRDLLVGMAPGWTLAWWFTMAAAMANVAFVLRQLVPRKTRRARAMLGVGTLYLSVVLGGALLHTVAYTLFFRTSLQHLRYFAPLLVLASAVAVPVVATSVRLFAGRGARRPRWRRWVGRLAVVAAVVGFGSSLGLRARMLPPWRHIYRENVRQLREVHFAAAELLRDEPRWCPGRVVAAFDIGVLRYVSGYRVVDLGGLLGADVAAYRRGRRNAEQIADARAGCYITLHNGFDGVGRFNTRRGFWLEPVRTFRTGEIDDPTPPHGHTMTLHIVNRCGERGWIRRTLGDVIEFDSAAVRARVASGEGRGQAFEEWPTIGQMKGFRTRGVAGAGYLTSFHPKLRDEATGRWESRWMQARGRWLRLLVAGGLESDGLALEVVDEQGRLHARLAGYRSDMLAETLVPLDGLAGQRFRLRLIDEAKGRWGHLSIDQVGQLDWVEQQKVSCLRGKLRLTPVYGKTRPELPRGGVSGRLVQPR